MLYSSSFLLISIVTALVRAWYKPVFDASLAVAHIFTFYFETDLKMFICIVTQRFLIAYFIKTVF